MESTEQPSTATAPTAPEAPTMTPRQRILSNLLVLVENQPVTGIAQATAIIEMGNFLKDLLTNAEGTNAATSS